MEDDELVGTRNW